MRYFIRALKYFIYIAALTAVILSVFVLAGAVEGNIYMIFEGGYSALWKIALFFAAVSAVYPKVGYIRREAAVPGSLEDNRSGLVEFFYERHYVIDSESAGAIVFRYKGFAGRFSRMFEDRITITAHDGGLELEGPRKDVLRLASGLEYHLNPKSED